MSKTVVVAIDAMGGEGSPKKIIEGISLSLKKDKDNFFQLYGKKEILLTHIEKNKDIKSYCEIFNIEDKIADAESPLAAAKKKEKTSMWSAINSLKSNDAHIALSAGNTGALLVLSRLILNMLENVDKPALAGLWPNKKGMNVVLDLGANIECTYKNLIDFSNMGSALFKALYPDSQINVGLLNVGLEENKGHETIKKAYSFLRENQNPAYNFYGYIEGNHIMDGDVNIIVTDGFTGNIALKTAEGTANFLVQKLKKIFTQSFVSKISALLSAGALKKFQKDLDPRKYNGAILLGLQGPVVKSHGSTDCFGFAYSIEMCNRIIRGNLIDKIKSNLLRNS